MHDNKRIDYRPMQPEDFANVITLGNQVHGEGYLTAELLQQYYQRGLTSEANASWVAYCANALVGFRLAFAPGQWQPDVWCSPALWPVPVAQVGYFKCNTVTPERQGEGIGGALLQHSIASLQQQGATAGLAHLWQQSPGNAAVKYFSRHGGELIKQHPDKWRAESLAGYACILCGHDCHCSAAEMLLAFPEKSAAPES